MIMKKIAALDLGSNSFLLLIASFNENGSIKVISDNCEVVQLAQGVQENKLFHPEALVRAETCFKKFSDMIIKEKVQKVVAVSTSAARDVLNKSEFIDLGKKYEIHIEIISGKTEAQLSFLGSVFDQPHKGELTVLDIGGGSTEFIFKNQEQDIEAISLDIGSVRLKEMFISSYPILPDEKDSLIQYIQTQLKLKIAKNRFSKKLLAVAGTPTTLACVFQSIEFEEEQVHGYNLQKATLLKFLNRCEKLKLEEIQKIKGIPSKRAEVIYVGSQILYEVMQYFEIEEVQVSTKGVRFGLVFKEHTN
jgi:exopolyphosphatase/guanosine-5'-triphosphate,3'-diphosphate pyrophosphatase